ncbi:TPA: hypothetical protein I8273_004567 [Aeromonas hydrophila]|nr:hypothetical protein [Aeromonas hydrophila]HAT2639030.1 hypothetical protein [Aeromonas hydrophila]HAT3424152.1 hypothetical protein [Aeromonas hydrophila]HAT3534191.1 hypothetical protein [Aeromonas hydrophila]
MFRGITPDVESVVPEGYQGRCKLIYDNSLAVFPSFDQAERAACIAVNPTVGGYSDVKIEVTIEEITHDTVDDWFLD